MKRILVVRADSIGRLHFDSDIKENIEGADGFVTIHQMRFSMETKLRGRLEKSVVAAIRGLGMASTMCRKNPTEYLDYLRDLTGTMIDSTKRLRGKMKEAGLIQIDPEGLDCNGNRVS